MEQRPSSEANRSLQLVKKFPAFVWKPKVLYRTHKCPYWLYYLWKTNVKDLYVIIVNPCKANWGAFWLITWKHKGLKSSGEEAPFYHYHHGQQDNVANVRNTQNRSRRVKNNHLIRSIQKISTIGRQVHCLSTMKTYCCGCHILWSNWTHFLFQGFTATTT
jgi:hypothetical protein